LWGAICHHGLLTPDATPGVAGTVIVSDGAGQFRVGLHALCWAHAERLIHKLVPATPEQHQAVEVTRALIWWLYADLKAWKLDPYPRRAAALRAKLAKKVPLAKPMEGQRRGALTASSNARPTT